MSTTDQIAELRAAIVGDVEAAADLAALEAVRVEALGKKGRITERLKTLGALPPEERKEAGQAFNLLKNEIEATISARQEVLKRAERSARLASEKLDVTLPSLLRPAGHIHPISQTIEELTQIFAEMGFSVAEGPEIEDDFHNFTALNMPPDHPARQMHDTFYLSPSADETTRVLRTHTSPVQ